MDLKVGDRVVVIYDSYCGGYQVGEKGKIINIDEDHPSLWVVFDNYSIMRHDLKGECSIGHGYFMGSECLKKCQVKNTELARFMYPNAKITECGGWLEI
jgi:hypothetical protein